MNRKSVSSRKSSAVAVTAPNLFLAGVGAVSLGRKQVLKSVDQAVDGVDNLRARLLKDFRNRQTRARKALVTLQTRAEGLKAQTERRIEKGLNARYAPLSRKVKGLIKQGRSQLESQVFPVIQPVLGKVGITLPKTKKAVAKKAKAAKAVRKTQRVVRKASRKVARRRA